MSTQVLYGRIAVLECLRAGARKGRRLYLLSGAKGIDDLLAAAGDLPVETVSRRDLDRMTEGGVHQGVALQADAPTVLSLKAWLAKGLPDNAVAVILDGVEDPHNFGAIVRSAAACGAQGVIFAKDRAAPISPVAVKSAAGGIEHVDLVRVTNLARSIDELKEAGFWVAALEADADQPLWKADLAGRVGLVIGSEGRGIRRLVSEHCDFHLCIPLPGPITSLNASTSAAIALAECLRQRSG